MEDMHNKELKHDCSDKNTIKIFIAENLPSLNKGEMEILGGMLESFKLVGKVELSMLSDHPEIDELRYGKRVKLIDLKKSLCLKGELTGFYQKFASIHSIFQHLLFLTLYKTLGLKTLKFMGSEIWKEYMESDVIIIGHDNTFGPGGGECVPLYFYSFYIPLFAKVLRKPVVIYGGTISKFKRFSKSLECISKFTLNKIDLITVREETSYQNLRKLGVKIDKIFVTADVAFLLQPVSSDQIKEIMMREGIEKTYRPLIGMTVTRRRASMAFPSLNPRDSYFKHNEIMAKSIDHVINEFCAFVVFVPHCIGFGDELDDRIIANDIFQLIKNKNRVKVIINEYGPEELKGLIGQFDLFIGERMHSVINAMSMCVPSIVISNSTDQRLGIIKMLGQKDIIYHVENIEVDALISKINDIWLKRDQIKEDLQYQTEIMKERALCNGKLLKELLESRRV